jgi:hypothetical protein
MAWIAATLIFAAGCLALDAQTGEYRGSETVSGQLAPQAAAGKRIELSGKVGQIHIAFGQGMPYFELNHAGGMIRVYLGPMPYLIAENFNPKTGQEVVVSGFRLEDRILAAQITFVAEKRTVKFRDERGLPVWRGGFGRNRGL